MKKYLQLIISLVITASLTACAPKINQKPSDSTNENSNSAQHSVYEIYTLYFTDTEQSRLVKEEHELRIYEDISREKLILNTLKMGPKSNQLTAPLTENAVIHSIKTVSGLCTIDISEHFLNATDENTQAANLMLHAIVQSLCELETIQQVKINIDGNTTAKINNEIDLSQPITPDPVNI